MNAKSRQGMFLGGSHSWQATHALLFQIQTRPLHNESLKFNALHVDLNIWRLNSCGFRQYILDLLPNPLCSFINVDAILHNDKQLHLDVFISYNSHFHTASWILTPKHFGEPIYHLATRCHTSKPIALDGREPCRGGDYVLRHRNRPVLGIKRFWHGTPPLSARIFLIVL